MDNRSNRSQTVLIVDDSPTIHSFVKAHLKGEPIQIVSAHDGNEALRVAQSTPPDLVLLDVEMPDPDGFEVCRRLKADSLTSQIPVVFLTGASSTDQKILGLDMGAVDYVTKPFDPAELRARVRASLRTSYLLELLSKKAQIDGLTGLWNRTYLDQRLHAELAASKRSSRPLSCIMADIDHFKKINDQYGHPIGDIVLRDFAHALITCARVEDIICRYGGEEFAILLPGIGATGATTLAERICLAVSAKPFVAGERMIPVTCSLGVADIDTSDDSLIATADKALYQAKANGRNRVVSTTTEGVLAGN